MALHGAIEVFGLAEVLGLLAATGQSGHLQLQGPDGEGSVWLRQGAVTAAASGRVRSGPAAEAVCDLLGQPSR